MRVRNSSPVTPTKSPMSRLAKEPILLAELIGAGIELNAAAMVHELGEAGLAVVAQGDDATGHAHRPKGLQLVVAGRPQRLRQPFRPVGHGMAPPEGIDAPPPQGGQLLVPLANLFGEVRLAHARPRDHSRYALMNSSSAPSITASTLPTSSAVRWSLMSW